MQTPREYSQLASISPLILPAVRVVCPLCFVCCCFFALLCVVSVFCCRLSFCLLLCCAWCACYAGRPQPLPSPGLGGIWRPADCILWEFGCLYVFSMFSHIFTYFYGFFIYILLIFPI